MVLCNAIKVAGLHALLHLAARVSVRDEMHSRPGSNVGGAGVIGERSTGNLTVLRSAGRPAAPQTRPASQPTGLQGADPLPQQGLRSVSSAAWTVIRRQQLGPRTAPATSSSRGRWIASPPAS